MNENPFIDNLVSPEDVKLLSGIDLDNLTDDENPSNKKERFIYEAQSAVCGRLQRYYKVNAIQKMSSMTENELFHFKLAIVNECKYFREHGRVQYDPQGKNGVKTIPDAVYNELSQANLTTGKLSGDGSILPTFMRWF